MDSETRVREQFRTDFSDKFLLDYVDQLTDTDGCGNDPYNHVGMWFGISAGRALQIWHDRAISGGIPKSLRLHLERKRRSNALTRRQAE